MATRLKFSDTSVTAPAPTEPKMVDVYDPKSDQIMQAPEADAAVLAQSGYKTGPEAQLEADIQGWQGKTAATGTAALRALSFGLSDAVMPRSLLNIEQQVREAHPVLDFAGEVVGSAPRMVAAGPIGRVLGSSAEGAITSFARERMRKEPVYSEALMQGAGWGALTGLFGEGVGAAIQKALPAVNKLVTSLAKKVTPSATEVIEEPLQAEVMHTVRGGQGEWNPSGMDVDSTVGPTVKVETVARDGQAVPRQGGPSTDPRLTQTLKSTREPATVDTMSGVDTDIPETWNFGTKRTPGATTYGRPLDPSMLDDATTLGTMVGGPKGYVGAKGAKALNELLPKYLNQGDEIAAAIDAIADGPMRKIGDTVRSLIQTGSAEVRAQVDHTAYDKVAAHVENAAVSPEAVQAYMEKTYGPLMDYAPEAMGAAIARAHATTGALHAALPRSYQKPGILPMKPFIPQAAKLRFMGYFNGVNDITYALARPTPETIEYHETHNPELMQYARDQVMGHLSEIEPNKLTLRQKRILSTIMGSPLAPENDPEFLDKLHTIASTPIDPPQPVTPKPTQSSKANLRDAPESELHVLE
jgi:hypothetical protein